jgi:YidC/Oxa1 family membrane protein insertase
LGCLPMFLQTPVWIALYAGLYLAVEMRHEPAFFGMFQSLTGDAWGFLADLSDQDHMFATFSEPVQVLLFRLTGVNGLPLMMGLIFYLQQKYMTPPATGTQTPEQEQMQKIMRWMLVLTFPLFLYGAPSGLTLYIVTSSTIGILESRWIRKKVDTMDLDSDPPPKPAGPRGGGSAGGSGDQSRAYSRAMSRYERRRDTRKKKDGRENRRPPRR